MGDYELVITSCKRLEGLLEKGLGASGRGLHEKVTSVQSKLSESLIKKLRFIATVRNRLVHDAEFQQLDDKHGYERACKEAEEQLNAMLRPAKSRRTGCVVALIALGIATALLAIALLVLKFS